MGIDLAVGLEGVILRIEHLHPRMGHGAAGGNAVDLVRDGAGRTGDTADVGGTGADDGGIRPLRPAGAELQHRAATGGTGDAVGLGGDQALMVDGQQREGLDELGLDGLGPDDDHGLTGKHRGSLRHGVDVAGEMEVLQIGQKFLAEKVPAPQIGDVFRREVQILNIINQLLQTSGDGIAAAIRHPAEKDVEVSDMILVTAFKVAIAHGQLVKVAEHGHVQLFLSFHFHTSSKFFLGVLHTIILSFPETGNPFPYFSPRSSPFRRFFPGISIKSVYQGLTKQSLLAIIRNCRVLLQVHTLSRVAEGSAR